MLSLTTVRGITLAASLVVTAAMLPVAQAQVSIGIGISVHVRLPHFPSTFNPLCLHRASSGHRATGRGATPATTGCLASGYDLQMPACFGPLVTGGS